MHHGAILPVLSILHICSGSLQGTNLLFECRIMSFIATVFDREEVDADIKLTELLGLLKNLSYFGEDHRLVMAENPFITLNLLSRIPFSNGSSEKNLERFSAILRNLALVPSSRPLLSQQSSLLSAVARKGKYRNKHIHRNVLNFFLALAVDFDSCVILCLHGDGIILSFFKRMLTNETDSVIRKHSVRIIIRLLACEGPASLLIHDTALMKSLSQRALHDISNEVRREACDAIVQISRFIDATMQEHCLILDTLTHLASSPVALGAESLAAALKKQAEQPINRMPMAERKMLLESLAQIAISAGTTNDCKEHACCAIYNLSMEESSRGEMATCSILEALVQNAMMLCRDEQEDSERCILGIKALVNLAEASSNRKVMAIHSRLLQTLVQYAALSRAEDTKNYVKGAIVVLVSEL